MFENLDIKDIILGVLVILVIYLIYKTRNLSEKFGSTTPVPTVSPLVSQAIADTYKVDLAAMRNLGQIANKILTNNDTLILPSTTTNISGNLIYKNNDIRNYLIGVSIYFGGYRNYQKFGDKYAIDEALYSETSLPPILLQSGKYVLATFQYPDFFVDKFVINPGFRLKVWSGVYNNAIEKSGSTINPKQPMDSTYYNPSFNLTTPAIIENNTNTSMIIIPYDDGSGQRTNINSVEIELL